jgi:uncharacterized protein
MSQQNFSFPRHVTLWKLIHSRFEHGDVAHDGEHVLRVYRWAVRLAPEADADVDLAGAAALVHDLVHVPKDSEHRCIAAEISARESLAPLSQAGYSAPEVSEIFAAVATSNWSRGKAPDNALGIVLQDADRLDAIGAIGIARCFSTAQAMSKEEAPGRFYHPEDPTASSGRELDDRQQALDHFYRKVLKLREGFRLPSAQAEATRRHAFLEHFIEEFLADVAAPSEVK